MDIIRRIWLPLVLTFQTAALGALGWLVWDMRAKTDALYNNDPATWGQEPDWVDSLRRSIEDAGEVCR